MTQKDIDDLLNFPILRPLTFVSEDCSNLDFKNLDLTCCMFRNCDLRGSDLSKTVINNGTSFDDAIFDENTKMPEYPMACPAEGEIIGWKKIIEIDDENGMFECIAELIIPETARRSSAISRKCRCDRAFVKSIFRIKDLKEIDEGFSDYDHNFIYKTGSTVTVNNFDPCRWHECAPGIHFYMTKQEAVGAYVSIRLTF